MVGMTSEQADLVIELVDVVTSIKVGEATHQRVTKDAYEQREVLEQQLRQSTEPE